EVYQFLRGERSLGDLLARDEVKGLINKGKSWLVNILVTKVLPKLMAPLKKISENLLKRAFQAISNMVKQPIGNAIAAGIEMALAAIGVPAAVFHPFLSQLASWAVGQLLDWASGKLAAYVNDKLFGFVQGKLTEWLIRPGINKIVDA